MSDIILMTGGARSGKSIYAEKFAKDFGGSSVLYIATASICDDEMEERVRKHRLQRPASWKTLEQFWGFEDLDLKDEFVQSKVILVDCFGFMLNNIMYHCGIDWDTCPIPDMERVEARMLKELDDLISLCRKYRKCLIGVTNEVGMGLVPAERSSRYYRDILGNANKHFAEQADQVIFMVSGIPMQVK